MTSLAVKPHPPDRPGGDPATEYLATGAFSESVPVVRGQLRRCRRFVRVIEPGESF